MEDEMDRAWVRSEIHTKFSLACPKGRDHSEDLSICGRIVLK
jgi:hypothetical protein